MKSHTRQAAVEYLRAINGWGQTSDRTNEARPCNCVGPQNGDPVCPCQMHSVSIRNGRYVRVIDLGPAPSRDDGNSD